MRVWQEEVEGLMRSMEEEEGGHGRGTRCALADGPNCTAVTEDRVGDGREEHLS